MNLTINRDDLLHGLEAVEKTITRNNPQLPILSHVLLQANGEFKLTAANLEQFAVATPACDITADGELTADGAKLLAITRKMPAGPITLEQDKNILRITGGSATCELVALDAAEFPQLPAFEEVPLRHEQFTIPQADLARALSLTSFATSTEESRIILTGVRFQIEPSERLTLAACDGHRLAEFVLPLTSGPEVPLRDEQFTLPNKCCAELLRLLGDEGDVTVTFTKNIARFDLESSAQLYTRLIEGEYPNYRKVIPALPHTVEIALAGFKQALERVSIVADTVILNTESDGLTVASYGAPDQGTAIETLDMDGHEPVTELAFDVKYLLDGLSHVKTDTIQLHYHDKTKPAILTVKDLSWRYMVQPVKL